MQPAKQHARVSGLLCLPATLWLILFSVVPILLIVGISFLSRDDVGTVSLPLTFENFTRFLGFGTFGFDPLYPQILLRTCLTAALATSITLGLALPLAFGIRTLPDRWRGLAMILLVIPLWTNLVVRTYAWQLLLGPESLITNGARALGWIGTGEGLYPSPGAVLVGLVADYLPFVTLPLYASVEKMDWTLVEAAADLGARGWRLFRHGVVPQILPGLSAGVTLTFIPALGQFLIPDLLGGGKTVLLGNLLEQQFGSSGDWPFGAAITVVSLALVAVGAALRARRRTA